MKHFRKFLISPLAACTLLAFSSCSVLADWSGFYAGGHVGYGQIDVISTHQNGSYWTEEPTIPPTARVLAPEYYFSYSDKDYAFSNPASGALLGLQAGYNLQFDRLVVGIEGTIAKSWIEKSKDSPYFPTVDDHKVYLHTLATAAARLGVLLSPDTLIYAKAGIAGAKIEVSHSDYKAGGKNTSEDERWYHGLLVGAGLEQKLNEHISIGLEYNYADFRANTVSLNNSGREVRDTPLFSRVDPDDLHTISLKLNFHF